jgi:hypothetical protein
MSIGSLGPASYSPAAPDAVDTIQCRGTGSTSPHRLLSTASMDDSLRCSRLAAVKATADLRICTTYRRIAHDNTPIIHVVVKHNITLRT